LVAVNSGVHLAMFTTYLELAVSIFATTFVVVFLYTLITSALHKSCKFVFRQIHFEIRCYRVFLIMNGLGLLLLSTSHISVAVYRLMRPCAWLAQDIVANVPLFLHQLAYGTCTVSMLLITIERTIIGLNPRLYVDKKSNQCGMIAVCVLSEVFIALPCIMLVQDGPIINGQKLYTTSEIKQQIACLICTVLDMLAVVMVIIAFACSSQRYNRVFSKSPLATRYQIKEVISLTRVLISICSSSLFFRFVVIVLAYFAFTDEKVLHLFFTIIRFCCTAAAIVEPTLLLTRHRMLRKRLRLIIGISEREVMPQIERDPAAIANVYFDAFNSDLNAKRR
ncbi:hypothetical protein PRIPAC_81954, partial [Pristionchus pacificus]